MLASGRRALDRLAGRHEIAVRCDDRCDASGAKQQSAGRPSAARASSASCRTRLRSPRHECRTAKAAAHGTAPRSSGLGQCWSRLAIVPIDDVGGVVCNRIKIDVISVHVEHVAPHAAGGIQQLEVRRPAEAQELIAGKQAWPGMLDRVEDPIGAHLRRPTNEVLRRFGDRAQPVFDGLREPAQVHQQHLVARQVFCLGKRAEDRLQDRRLGPSDLANLLEARDLRRQMWTGCIERLEGAPNRLASQSRTLSTGVCPRRRPPTRPPRPSP